MSDETSENDVTPIPGLDDLAPAVGAGYWESIDARLEASSLESTDTNAEVIGLDGMADTQDIITPTSASEGGSNGRLLLAIAAAVALVAGIGIFALLGQDEPTPLDTADTPGQQDDVGEDDTTGVEPIDQAPASDASPLGFWLAVDLDRGADGPIPTDRGFGPLLSLRRDEVQDLVTLVESEENLVGATDSCSAQIGTFDWDSSGAFDARAFEAILEFCDCLLYTSPSPRDRTRSRMPSSA